MLGPVTVKVTGPTCKLEFLKESQYELTMPSNVRPVVIQWNLDEPSRSRYEFRRGAFRLKSGSSDQFDGGTPRNGESFRLVNAHSNDVRYTYDLVVHSKDGSSPTSCNVDPFINNVN